MIDWHTHILPEMDDGSRSVEESKQMLQALHEQEIDCVIATPHFLANREPVEHFLARREQAYRQLSQLGGEDLPRGRLRELLRGTSRTRSSGLSQPLPRAL